MAHFLLAAELGAGFGHVAPMRALAKELVARGHRCSFAVRDLDVARDYLTQDLGPLLQAPVKLVPPQRPLKILLSFTSILYNCGFDEPVGLATRLRAWRDLIELTGCDYLIADHSPTAILAAKTLSLPVGVIGTGFSIPPLRTPFPSFGTDVAASDEQLRANDNAVLQVINQALQRVGAHQSLASLQALFHGAAIGLLTYSELDHYGLPRELPYLGVPDFSSGVDVNWGERREPRIFAYLRPSAALPAILKALHETPAQVVARVAGASSSDFSAYVRPGLVVVDQQVNLRAVAESCDAIVNYAAHGTAAQMLLSGKPGLLIYATREQSMVAARAAALGAAISMPTSADAPYAAALTRLIEDSSLRASAQEFSSRYATQDRAAILPSWCESLPGSGR